MSFKQWILNEGAFGIADLKTQKRFIVLRIDDSMSFDQAFTGGNPPSQMTIMLMQGNPGLHGKYLGEVFMELVTPKDKLGGMSAGVYATHSEAPNGWGPFLYDLALELAALNGHKVMSTQGAAAYTRSLGREEYSSWGGPTTSDAAQNVWKFYHNRRPDVKKLMGAAGSSEHETGKEFLGAQYMKKVDLLHKLSAEGLIVDPMGRPLDFTPYA
jgi:hypothetical protein